MAVFVEAGRGQGKWEARKSISGAVRWSPGQAVQAGIRGIEFFKDLTKKRGCSLIRSNTVSPNGE